MAWYGWPLTNKKKRLPQGLGARLRTGFFMPGKRREPTATPSPDRSGVGNHSHFAALPRAAGAKRAAALRSCRFQQWVRTASEGDSA